MEIKPMIEWTEEELRTEAEKRKRQYRNAQHRVDNGCFNCISQAQNYMFKYARILNLLNMKNCSLSEEEKQVVSLLIKRI